MSYIKKNICLLLVMLVCVFTLMPIKVQAASEGYKYTVRLHLATNDENVKFKETSDRTLEFEASYGEEINLANLAEIADPTSSKYQIIGIREAGESKLYGNAASHTVTKDQDFVVAYGIGQAVEYFVEYVDENGNKLADDQSFYGIYGDELTVSYLRIEGYTPTNKNFYTQALLPKQNDDGTFEKITFRFTYIQGENVITNDTYELVTIVGEGGTTYQYVTVPGGVTTVAAGGAGGGAAAGGAGAAGGAVANADAGNADQGGAVIADEPVPQEGPADVVEIDDGQTALAGGEKEGFVFPIIAWVIVALAAATIIFTVIMLNKRKKAVVKTNTDETKKSE